METTEAVGFVSAFMGGLLSFLTPCVLPLVPVYLSILSGTSFDQMTGKVELTAAERRAIHVKVLSNAVAFIVGFSIVFIALGFVSAEVGKLLTDWGQKLVPVIGAILIVLGINMAGIWKPRFLSREARFRMQKGKMRPVGGTGPTIEETELFLFQAARGAVKYEPHPIWGEKVLVPVEVPGIPKERLKELNPFTYRSREEMEKALRAQIELSKYYLSKQCPGLLPEIEKAMDF